MLDRFVPLAALLLGAGGMRLLEHLREHREEPAGLSELLNYAFLLSAPGEPGVVLQKDGALLAGWRYRGPDLASATRHELDRLVDHVNRALRPLGTGWMLHFDAVRRPAMGYAPPGAFPDPVTALIDEERRRAYEASDRHLVTEAFLVATYLPPREVYSRLARHFVQGGSGGGEGDWERQLAGFGEQLADLDGRLSAALRLERLSSEQLLAHLHACLTGLHHPISPGHGAYLDVLLADRDLLGGWSPRVGDQHVRLVAIHGFPDAAQAAMLDALASLGWPLRWSTRFLPLDTADADRLIRQRRLGWFQARRGAGSWARMVFDKGQKSAREERDEEMFLDSHAAGLVADASAAAAANASGAVRFGITTQTIVILDPSAERADEIAAEVVKLLNSFGLTARVETVNAVEAFLGSLPGHGTPNLRGHLLHSENLAAQLPLTSVWPGLDRNPSHYFPEGSPPLLWGATSGSTPFRVNLHVDDVGHTLVIGPTGSGKSTLVGLIAAQWLRYPEAQVFLFDVGYSYYLLAHAAGARHYPIAATATDAIQFQPLARIDEPGELAWASQWLQMLLTLVKGVELTPVATRALDHALELLARDAPEHRTLTTLYALLQEPNLKAGLRAYTVSGTLGYLLDATRDDLEDGPFQVIELRHLLDMAETALLPVLTYLFHRIELRLDSGRPTLIVIEEAWLALLSSAFRERIRSWLLTLRKQNAAVLLVTQSLAQLTESAHGQIIFESCPTRILLPNPNARSSPEAARLYRALGLNETEIATIAEAVPKRQYYLKSPQGSRLFELALGPLALAFLAAPEGSTLQETLRAADRCRELHGSGWPRHWLADRSLGDWAETYRLFNREDRKNR